MKTVLTRPDSPRFRISLAITWTTGRRVSDERIQLRVEIRSRCRYVRIRKTRGGVRKLNCGICGCRPRGRRALINLARYEETRRWGCKHPNDSRWKKRGDLSLGSTPSRGGMPRSGEGVLHVAFVTAAGVKRHEQPAVWQRESGVIQSGNPPTKRLVFESLVGLAPT